MSSDLVTRLREYYGFDDALKAADAIEALEGEVAALREDRDSHQRQCIAAIARAERLRVALEEIKSDPVTAVAVAERALEGN